MMGIINQHLRVEFDSSRVLFSAGMISECPIPAKSFYKYLTEIVISVLGKITLFIVHYIYGIIYIEAKGVFFRRVLRRPE